MLGGRLVLPAGGAAMDELRAAIRMLVEHPNTAPFISRQLIQKLVTSDPTPAYVARVARIFKDNGRGQRGDLAAVTRAVLLDPEARGARKVDPRYGRLREPALFWTAIIRALDLTDRRRDSLRRRRTQRPAAVPRAVRLQLLRHGLRNLRGHASGARVRHLRFVGISQSLEPARAIALRRGPSDTRIPLRSTTVGHRCEGNAGAHAFGISRGRRDSCVAGRAARPLVPPQDNETRTQASDHRGGQPLAAKRRVGTDAHGIAPHARVDRLPGSEVSSSHSSARRRWLQAAAASGLLGAVERQAAWAATASDYKALVCIFQQGGNDGENTLIRYDTQGYARYAAVRTAASGVNIARASLLPIQPASGRRRSDFIRRAQRSSRCSIVASSRSWPTSGCSRPRRRATHWRKWAPRGRPTCSRTPISNAPCKPPTLAAWSRPVGGAAWQIEWSATNARGCRPPSRWINGEYSATESARFRSRFHSARQPSPRSPRIRWRMRWAMQRCATSSVSGASMLSTQRRRPTRWKVSPQAPSSRRFSERKER